MKKFLALILALVMILSLAAGCGTTDPAGSADDGGSAAGSADPVSSDYDPEIYYNNGGFNVPGLTFQPAKPDTIGSRFEPVEVFENVYFIGDTWVCCLLYVTDQGNIIMWDALEYEADYEDILVPDMEKLGLDPADIKTVLLSHGHFDHIGLSGFLEETNGAEVYICEDDEELMLSNEERYAEDGTPLPKNYKFYGDGDTYTLDNVTFTFMHTPGHTDGSMSFFVPVTDFDGEEHILCCWGGTSAPRDAEGTQVYLGSVQKFRDYIADNGVDCFLSMHPFVDYSTDNVAMVRESGSSDALIKTPEQMDFFMQTLHVYTVMKGKLAEDGITEFTNEGYGSKVLSMPYIVYIPEEDTGNGYMHLDQEIKAEIFDDVYLIGNGTDASLLFDTTDGIVVVDAMTSEDDFTDCVQPAMESFGLDPADITAVMLTHGHADKYGFANYLKDAYGAKIYMNKLDEATAEADYATATAAGKTISIPDVDEDLTAGNYTFGQFRFDWYATPGHTPGTMSFTVNVTVDGEAHTAALWGGTTFNYEKAQLAAYVDSIAAFIDACNEKGADALVSTHPYFNYEVEKINDLLTGDAEAFILSDANNTVEFALKCISLTAQYKLKYNAV